MALIKADHRLEQVSFVFDDSGEVVDVQIQVNYAVQDDATGDVETRVRKRVSVWDRLPPGISKAVANTFGKRCRDLAPSV